MQQISISDIQRNLHKLKDFDIVEIVDKKRNNVKGYFVDKKHAHVIEALINQQKQSKDSSKKLAGSLHSYANNSLHRMEKAAWQKQVEERYQP